MQGTANRTVIGVFDDYAKAQSVARDLENAGIDRSAIDIKSNLMTGTAGRGGEYTEGEHEHHGGISGFFHRIFGGGDDTDYEGHYSEAVRRGNAVVAVTAPEDRLDEVVQIMNSAGAVDIDRHVESYRRSGGYEHYDPNAPAYTHEEATMERERFRKDTDNTAIPVIEEELQVGKRAVRRGGVRVYSRVVEQPVEQDIQLREEHVRVERRPVDRPTNPGDRDRLRDASIEVTEIVEEPVVQKRARVREEVVVGKETTQRTEKVRDTVRRTEVEVEQLNPDDTRRATADYGDDFYKDWERNYQNSGEPYESYQPAYEYGYRSAGDPRYKGRSWKDAEEDVKTDYMRNNPNSSWERMKGSVRYGWEKMTGKR